VLRTTVYFVVNDDEVWKSDGTPGGTVQLVDLQQGAASVVELASMDGALYILSPSARTLSRSDGMSATLTAVATFADEAAHLRARAGKLYLDVVNHGLWTSDGTPAGTQQLLASTRADPQRRRRTRWQITFVAADISAHPVYALGTGRRRPGRVPATARPVGDPPRPPIDAGARL
jgi:ELWxxDGT repeat protein